MRALRLMDQAVPISVVLYVMLGHWIGDFVLQPRWMGENKSSNISVLVAHAVTYGFFFFVWSIIGMGFTEKYTSIAALVLVASNFAFPTMLLHGFVDGITSRITHWMWGKKRVWGFFTVIGLDQFLHLACLLWVLNLHLTGKI